MCQRLISVNVSSTGIKLLSNLPSTTKYLNHDIKLFKLMLSHSFSSVKEFTLTKNSQLQIDEI